MVKLKNLTVKHQLIKDLRNKKKWTQAEIAEKINIHPVTYSAKELGKQQFLATELAELS